MSEPNKPTPNLDTATTDELVDELRRRHDNFYLVGRPKARGGMGFDWHTYVNQPEDGRYTDTIGLIVCCLAFDVVKYVLEQIAEANEASDGE